MRISSLMMSIVILLISTASFAQSVGGGGSGGGGLRDRTFRKGGCIEGRKVIFHEVVDGEKHVAVSRICQNGSYYDLTDYVYNPKVRCMEGRIEIWTITNKQGDKQQVRHICQNGKFVPVDYKGRQVFGF